MARPGRDLWHAVEQDVLQACMTPGGKNDEVDRHLSCQADNRIDDLALPRDCLAGNFPADVRFGNLLQSPIGSLDDVTVPPEQRPGIGNVGKCR